MIQLSQLIFSDLYLGRHTAVLSGVPGGLDPYQVPSDYHLELNELREIVYATGLDKEEFAIRFQGTSYRVSTLQSVRELLYVLRKFPTTVPELTDLGIAKPVLVKLLTPGVTGLIIIAGTYANGKTTTASALVKARLSEFGGVGITIEDPVEMPLEGVHGKGVCWQTEVKGGEFAKAMRAMARRAPSIIFLGEIRDTETALEVLRASSNGCLVVCTTHSDSVITAITRLYDLAADGANESSDVSNMLSNGLFAVIHQKLEGLPKRPKVEFLFLDQSPGARTMIRNRKFELLGSEITQQFNKLIRNTLESN